MNRLLIIFFILLSANSFAQTYNNNPRVFNVKDFGAKGDSVTNDTRAIQAAINAADSVGNGSVVWFPNATVFYNIADTLRADCNCQLNIPVEAGTKRTGIILQGETTPSDNPVGGGLPTFTTTKSLVGVRIKSTLTTGATGAAIFGTSSATQSNVVYFKNLSLEVENPAVIGGINWHNGSDIYIDRLSIYSDTAVYLSSIPTQEVSAIELPDGAQAGNYVVSNTHISGFRNGIYFSEHTNLYSDDIWGCWNGLKIKAGGHASYISQINIHWCKNDIYVGTQALTLKIDELTDEYATTAYVGAKWYVNAYTLNDSLNNLTGMCYYKSDSTGQSGYLDHFTKNGGTLFNAYSLHDSTALAKLNAPNNRFYNITANSALTTQAAAGHWSGYIGIGNAAKGGWTYNRFADNMVDLLDSTNSLSRMSMDVSGNLLIGSNVKSTPAISVTASSGLTQFNYAVNFGGNGGTSNGQIGATGKVGFGTTTLTYPMQVVGATNNYISTFGDGTRTLGIYAESSGIPIGFGTLTSSDLGIFTANGSFQQLLLKVSGNVDIGNNNDTYKLDVNGTANVGSTLHLNGTPSTNSETTPAILIRNASTGNVEQRTSLPIKYAHTITTPTTGGTVTLVVGQYNIINPAGALVALTVNLPSSPANNDVVYIKYTQAITTVTYGNGTVVDGITAPTAGGLVVLTYDSGTTSWY